MVDGGTRSRTAQGVAALRAVLTDLGIVDDPLAQSMLDPTTRRMLWLVRRFPRAITTRSLTLAGYSARVLWVDQQVVDALDDGLDQVVVVGAGYDSRAWRMARPGVPFYEVDHPATQQDKARRAPGPGPIYVAADLRRNDVADTLCAAGFDADRRALFVIEGVTMYLDRSEVVRLLRDLATSSAPSSLLVVDFDPGSAVTRSQQRQARLTRLARSGSGEAFRLAVDAAGAASIVESAGWQVAETVGGQTLARRLLPDGHGLRVADLDDRKTFIRATHH